jgi:hypothetical protein
VKYSLCRIAFDPATATLLDLSTNEARPLDEVNSEDVDSYNREESPFGRDDSDEKPVQDCFYQSGH